jgi:hypothetical protein
MKRPSAFALAAYFPSLLLLLYLALHATEGWQLLVVAVLTACFVVASRRRSGAGLIASYILTGALTGWVAWVNV